MPGRAIDWARIASTTAVRSAFEAASTRASTRLTTRKPATARAMSAMRLERDMRAGMMPDRARRLGQPVSGRSSLSSRKRWIDASWCSMRSSRRWACSAANAKKSSMQRSGSSGSG